MGRPASASSCFGAPLPKRVPRPAAAMIAETCNDLYSASKDRGGGYTAAAAPAAVLPAGVWRRRASARVQCSAPRLTFSASAVGAEGAVIKTQLARFAALHPEIPVQLQVTPDAADQRHQLYVQWL